MLSELDNQTLTRTGPETPMGRLFRRFWMPALLPGELPAPDCPPIRVRILGEDLVAFRDSNGKAGFLAQACPHRGASLFFGRNEEAGLRCVYHGWKFDAAGACVDMPSEPAESNFKSKVRATAYPSAEYGGIVWIYMGPPEKQPPLPQYDWTRRDYPNLRVYKHMQESNYLQSLEGNIDIPHETFLHRTFGRSFFNLGIDPDVPPLLQLEPSEFGFVYGGRRETPDGEWNWRIFPYVWPTFVSVANPGWDGQGIFVVPMDDEHCWWFSVSPPGVREAAGAPQREYVELEPGGFRQTDNRENDYGLDREVQRTFNYSGLQGNRVQDSAVTESMGRVVDRTREHLGALDLAVIHMRRGLLRMARELEQGIEPSLLHDGSLFGVRPVNETTPETDMLKLWNPDRADYVRSPIPAPPPLVS